jgi:hypothetical protein
MKSCERCLIHVTLILLDPLDLTIIAHQTPTLDIFQHLTTLYLIICKPYVNIFEMCFLNILQRTGQLT